ncbi:VanZ family protein [Rossellomorea marisflavi]|uniref:VanZ family protein n=1 Tax=Rossellomorea marisflavi TaxID=189381 RepID=UPI003458CAAD
MKSVLKIGLTVAPFLYMLLIWYLSSNPDDKVLSLPERDLDRFIKESLHLIEFGILYALFVLALLAHGKLTYAVNTVAALIAIFYGFTDEIHQAFVPARSATMIDAAKDLIGVTILYWLVNHTYFRFPDRPLGRWLKSVEKYFTA